MVDSATKIFTCISLIFLFFLIVSGISLDIHISNSKFAPSDMSHDPRNPFRKWDYFRNDENQRVVRNRKTGQEAIVPDFYGEDIAPYVGKKEVE